MGAESCSLRGLLLREGPQQITQLSFQWNVAPGTSGRYSLTLTRGEYLALSRNGISNPAQLWAALRNSLVPILGKERAEQLEERVLLHNTQTGTSETRDIQHVFMMTGADPNTEWLRGSLALDTQGFIKTGAEVQDGWPLRRPPYLLETSRPGVFAVGDIRSASVKRVASAVGEGSMVVQFVHKVLAE